MLLLASQSPRRAELLRNAGIPFDVLAAHVPEQLLPGEPPRDYVLRLARAKALAVLAQRPEALVLGADTTVVVDEHILEKPRDAADAARMLRLLSGRAHQVITGVCLAWFPPRQEGQPSGPLQGERPTPKDCHSEAKRSAAEESAFPETRQQQTPQTDARAETTDVCFTRLSEEDIADYIRTGEPMDKAGAYAIQGIASRWVERINGCYFNVVGLPVPLVWRMLRERQAGKQ